MKSANIKILLVYNPVWSMQKKNLRGGEWKLENCTISGGGAYLEG